MVVCLFDKGQIDKQQIGRLVHLFGVTVVQHADKGLAVAAPHLLNHRFNQHRFHFQQVGQRVNGFAGIGSQNAVTNNKYNDQGSDDDPGHL
ncbi:hypothetical protein D3C71_1965460 [compost metagenome]